MSGRAAYWGYKALSYALIPFLPFYLRKRARAGKEIHTRLNERTARNLIRRPNGKLIWLHAASVGESTSALPLLNALLDANPEAHALMTTGTRSSAELMAERLPPRAFHQFAPLDQPLAVSRFFRHWRPDLALMIESEFWPNLLHAFARNRVPAALVNARMSDRSAKGWARAKGFARRLLSVFDVTLAQSEETAVRLRTLGAQAVTVTGNLKAAAGPLAAAPAALAELKSGIGARPVLTAASTQEPEEEVLGRIHLALRTRFPGLLTVIAPRHPTRGDQLAEQLRALGLGVARRSKRVRITADTQIYLMDTIGELGLLYRLSPFVFLGRSLSPHGGSNPLEPARLGVMTLHGPHVFNFRGEFESLDAAGGALAVGTEQALTEAVARLLADTDSAQRAGAAAQLLAERDAAALSRCLSALKPLLERGGLHAPA